MGIKLNHMVVAVAVLAIACTGFAQPTGGGGGGGGRGGQRGFGGMMRNNPFSLLNVKEVQTELKISADEQTKIDALSTEYRDASRKARQDAQAAGTSREDQMAASQKLSDDYTTKLNAILTADQQKRLKELRIQLAGNRALLQADVQKALNFTQQQKDDAKALGDKAQAANGELFQKVRNQEITQEDAQKTMAKNNETLGTELLKLLTPDQATQFKAMSGAPFTFPKDMPGMGGPGMGRRGGGGAGPGGPGGGGGGGG